jgi:hypothetical protein
MKTNHKKIIVLLCIWSFIHLFLFIKNKGVDGLNSYKYANDISYWYSAKKVFYPFTSGFSGSYPSPTNNFDNRFYDFSELFFYVGGAWLIFFLIKFLNNKNSDEMPQA